MFKRFIKAIVDTAKDPDLFSSRPHHGKPQTCPACNGSGSDGCPNDTVDELCETCGGGGKLPLHHQGWENDDKCCPNCGLVECTCYNGKDVIHKDCLEETMILVPKYDGLVEYLIVRSYGSWEYSRPGDCTTHYTFPDDVNIKVHQQRIGDLLVTIQEVK